MPIWVVGLRNMYISIQTIEILTRYRLGMIHYISTINLRHSLVL